MPSTSPTTAFSYVRLILSLPFTLFLGRRPPLPRVFSFAPPPPHFPLHSFCPFLPSELTRSTPLPLERSNIPRSKKEGFDPPSSLSHQRHPSAGLADLRQPTQAAGELGNGQSISQGLLDQFERSSQQERVLQGWDLTGTCIFSLVLKGWEGREGRLALAWARTRSGFLTFSSSRWTVLLLSFPDCRPTPRCNPS